MREKLRKYLLKNKMRQTPERFAILDKVLGLPRNFTATDVAAAMSDSEFRVSSATIYGALNLFIEAGILQKLVLKGGRAHYELRSRTLSHIHLICEQCGKIKILNDPEFVATMRAKRFQAFTTSYYTLNVYGICNDCARRKKKHHK